MIHARYTRHPSAQGKRTASDKGKGQRIAEKRADKRRKYIGPYEPCEQHGKNDVQPKKWRKRQENTNGNAKSNAMRGIRQTLNAMTNIAQRARPTPCGATPILAFAAK